MNLIELALQAGGKHVIEMPCEYYKLTDENLTKFAELLQAQASEPYTPNKDCDMCKGSGQYCTGRSGSEEDGNAPILERCECYLDNIAQASEPVAWILDHTPNRAMRQVSCSKPYVDNEMSKGVEWNKNKFSQGQYPYDVCTPLYTSPPNTQAEIAKLRAVLKDERESASDLTKTLVEKVREKIELQAKLDKAREALQKIWEGTGSNFSAQMVAIEALKETE